MTLAPVRDGTHGRWRRDMRGRQNAVTGNMRSILDSISSKYSYRVQWSGPDGEYVGTVLEFPSMSSSPVDALNGIQNLVREGIEILNEDGDPIPVPLSERNYSGRFTVRILPDLHRRLAMEAQEQHVSFNRLVADKLSV